MDDPGTDETISDAGSATSLAHRRAVASAGMAARLAIGVAWLAIALAGTLATPAAVSADDGGPARADLPPRSCADRYPADGPAGLDLQLGCVAAEIVGAYTGAAQSGGPPRISAWLLPLGALAGGLIGIVVILRRLNGGLDRRLAPAAPASWWSCPRCRSLNADHLRACYACGQPWTATALSLASPDSPPVPGEPAPQSDRATE